MNGWANKLGALVLLPLLGACSGISTSVDWDPNIDFATYQTYGWVPDGSAEGAGMAGNTLIDSRIRSSVEQGLEANGLRKVDLPQADLAVGYQLTSQDRVSYQTVSTGWGGGYGRRGRRGGWGGGMSTTYESNYTDGTIILALFENSERELVFQGSATSTLDPGASADERTEAIGSAVSKILKEYPAGN